MASGRPSTRAPDATRRTILDAAFGEFYVNGFQGGSLNHAPNNLAREMSPLEPLFAAYIQTGRNLTSALPHAARARPPDHRPLEARRYPRPNARPSPRARGRAQSGQKL